MQRDLYQVLGIGRSASQAEIRAAYVRLAKRHHPDTDGSLPGRLLEVQQAYRCLSNGAERARHDAALGEEARQHFLRQRALHRRLHRHDQRRGKHAAPTRRAIAPRSAMAIAVGAVLVALLSLKLIG